MVRVRFPLLGTILLLTLWSGQRVFAQEVNCYIDSQAGNDDETGLAEAKAVKSQSKIPQNCTVVHYKRGSVFNEKLKLLSNVKTYTNYGTESDPLPKFVVERTEMSGPVVQAMMVDGITIDGLYLEGATGNGTMDGLIGGVCVVLGSNSQLLNSEITKCDIGIMLFGTGSLVQGNYVHDLIMGVDGNTSVDPNSVGGAEGIFINASNNEVSYNTFVRCKGDAAWTSGSCDGGATEVAIQAGKEIRDVKVHHNFSYDSCGFFEVSTGGDVAGDGNGTFRDSRFYENVVVDSGWMALLQVNNTDLSNVQFYNNTLVQHQNSTNTGILWIIFTGTSSGVSGGDLQPNTVFLTNNLFVLDGVTTFGDLIHENFVQTTNLLIKTPGENPGFVNLDGTTAAEFDLTDSSPAKDCGTVVSGNTLDFLNRAVPYPAGGNPDVGAFEYGSTVVDPNGPIAPPPGPPPSDPTDPTDPNPTTNTGGGGGGCASGVGTNGGSASATVLLSVAALPWWTKRRRTQTR